MNKPYAVRLGAAYDRFSEIAIRAPRGAMADVLNGFALTLALQAGNPCESFARDAQREVERFAELAERKGLAVVLRPMITEMADAAALAKLAALV